MPKVKRKVNPHKRKLDEIRFGANLILSTVASIDDTLTMEEAVKLVAYLAEKIGQDARDLLSRKVG